jgi:quercetin dioxygenase-like cupin family protein
VASKAEMFGRALGKAVKHTVAGLKAPDAAPVLYRTNIRDVPKLDSLARNDGWVDAQVQLLIDKASAGADHMVGRTVLRPGARHDNHRHLSCDAFFIVLAGHGMILTDAGDKPAREGDVVYAPRGCWHGFANTSDGDVVLVWGVMGAGSIEASGYQVHPNNRKE